MAPQPTTAGIITDEASGERHIPASVRADGSTRKAIKIRPGYKPPEDVEVYRNRTAESFRNRYKGGVVGAEAASDSTTTKPGGQAAPAAGTGPAASAAANKNAKRREARKKAAAADKADSATPAPAAPPVDPAVEREKKARGLKKKLKQAKELKSKRDGGEALLPEQIAKVIRINELVRELDALGFDAEGEPKAAEAAAETGDKEDEKKEKTDKEV